MAEPPAPLVPAEVDLRGYEFMPLYGARLRDSELNSRATDAEFRAAINLWWSSWNQVPAASLPYTDIELCRLADLGRDLRAWAKVKGRALHGFIACSDGRLYHVVLSAIALEAWQGRVNATAKGKYGASKRWEKHRHQKVMAQASENNGTGNARAIENDSKRSGSGSGSGSTEQGVGLSKTPTRRNGGQNLFKKTSEEHNQEQLERNRRIALALASGDEKLARKIRAGKA
jgi:hypothetical protein